MPELPIVVPWITANTWSVGIDHFSVQADISQVIAHHGDGVYTILVWGNIDRERVPISQYSIFYGVTPPEGYSEEG